MQNFCGKCGTKLSSESKFCTNCGAPIENKEEASDEDIKKELRFETKPEEMTDNKDTLLSSPLESPKYNSQDQKIDPKIKRISFIVLGLIISIIINHFIFNYPRQSSLTFNYDESSNRVLEQEIETFQKLYREAWELADEEGNGSLAPKYISDSPIKLAEIFNALNTQVKTIFPLFDFGSTIRPTLLIIIMILISFAVNELIKNPLKLKWLIISLNLSAGVLYSFILFLLSDNENRLISYLLMTGSIIFSLLAFYNSRKIMSWILISAIISIIYTVSTFDQWFGYYLLRIRLSSLVFYFLTYLESILSFILPCIAFFLFINEFIYKNGSKDELKNKQVYN